MFPPRAPSFACSLRSHRLLPASPTWPRPPMSVAALYDSRQGAPGLLPKAIVVAKIAPMGHATEPKASLRSLARCSRS
jgi:hypothetical protein